ncbi:MAG: anhydro-N-acetylmuramic acid kinase [Cyclobacteriaceae bacterium]
MSGTSLDGLDLCYCQFWEEGEGWSYKILDTGFEDYPEELLTRLTRAKQLTALDLKLLDVDYGRWLGTAVKNFITDKGLAPQFISSHGYTVFHQPEQSMTCQIGSGHEIYSACQVPVVYNFRELDVSLGGQGAPLVPIGDHFLFSKYDYCLNLGGIANLSCIIERKRIAYDIAPANMILNHQAGRLGLDYDKNGSIASEGNIDSQLLKHLSSLDYYQQDYPKSLGSEWVEGNILSIKELERMNPSDVLASFCQHISDRICDDITVLDNQRSKDNGKVLITGGGAKNAFLVNKLKEKLPGRIVVPNNDLIDYKEALIFAFLGLLRIKGLNNCLASVTGASRDCSGGEIISEQKIIL